MIRFERVVLDLIFGTVKKDVLNALEGRCRGCRIESAEAHRRKYPGIKKIRHYVMTGWTMQ